VEQQEGLSDGSEGARVISELGPMLDLRPRFEVCVSCRRQHCWRGGDTSTGQAGWCEAFVRSPRRRGLARVLIGMGATVLVEHDHGLSVTGLDAHRIASAAAARHIPIQELTPRSTPSQDTNLATAGT
jgi:hypothetical protein